MTTARRRPLEPNLSWPSGGVGRQYRVAVRNEETGERRTIYDGTRPSCRLPADLRLSSDQLAFRVESRLADDTYAPFRRHIEFTGIDRTGDDFETPSPDLIVEPAHDRATAYRLVVRDSQNRDDRFADFQRAEPRFLLPPGRLEGRKAEYTVLPRVDDRWLGGRWKPVTPEMIAAAQARSERLIELPREPSPRDAENDAEAIPGRLSVIGERAVDHGTLIAVDATIAPLLAEAPDSSAVLADQWMDGAGRGLLGVVADRLEAASLRGVFFLDAEAGTLFDAAAAADVARRLIDRGHAVELLYDPSLWRAASDVDEGEDAELGVSRAIRQFAQMVGRQPRLVRLAASETGWSSLSAFARAGLDGAVIRPGQADALPRWMRGRVRPFALSDTFAVLPVSTIISTPAHARDRVVRHELTATDAMIASTVPSLMAAQLAARSGQTASELMVAYIDPLALLAVQRTVNPKRAEAWNAAVSDRSDWARGGWTRGDDGYDFANGISEVALDILDGFISGLAGSGGSVLGASDLDAASLARWVDDGRAWDLMIEQRRGPRSARRSVVRRYDNAYRQALRMTPA